MPDFFSNYAILCIGAFIAGLVDAVVGGGGLVLIPTLFSVFPNMLPTMLFSTDKVASVMGTSAAAYIIFARKVKIQWTAAAPAAVSAVCLVIHRWLSGDPHSHRSDPQNLTIRADRRGFVHLERISARLMPPCYPVAKRKFTQC